MHDTYQIKIYTTMPMQRGEHMEKRHDFFVKRDKKILYCLLMVAWMTMHAEAPQTLINPKEPVSQAKEKSLVRFTNFAATEKYLKNNSKQELTLRVQESPDSPKCIERNATLIYNPSAKANVLICHGFMCNRYDISFIRLLFSDFNVMTFDFRAHGENIDGQFCTLGCYEALDVASAAKFMRTYPPLADKPLILYGFSMGAVASIKAQSEDPTLFDAMILDCPFDSSDKLLERGLNCMKINILGYEMDLPGTHALKSYAYSPYIQTAVKYFMKTIAKMDATQVNTTFFPINPFIDIKKVKVPLFIISCVNDEKVPVKALLKVYEAAGSDIKRAWITKGVRHFDSLFANPELYRFKVNNFINKFLSGALAKTNHKKKIIYDDPEWPLAIKQNRAIKS